tara:strand:- start:758 stop:1681 length:924 start_codon:yes stop_codon:yes gene_type:complete
MSETFKKQIIVEPGSREWREARANLITGSRVAGVLGAGGFKTDQQVLREMVSETLGDFEHTPPNVAMKWGTEHEAEALSLYKFLYAGPETVELTGFWVKDRIGASPDALVGDNGLVEIKCPWKKREDTDPQFSSIDDLQHYWHQIQAQLYCTEREWCDFFQWTPKGFRYERVVRDKLWYKVNKKSFEAFYLRYEKAVADAQIGGPQQKISGSEKWSGFAEQYITALQVKKAAESDLENAKEGLTALMNEEGVDLCEGQGIKAMRVTREGAIDYRALALDKLSTEALALSEDFRKKSSSYLKFTVTGE